MFRVKRFFKKKNKFNATATQVDGYNFPSKKEAGYYQDLKIRVMPGGDVLFFLRQVPFHLPGNTTYRVDFQVFYQSGEIAFIDVKGRRTKAFIRAKKQVEALYPVTIEER